MALLNSYFTIANPTNAVETQSGCNATPADEKVDLNESPAAGTLSCDLTLNPDHEIYQGHFPERPICPGICSIKMMREAVSAILGRPLNILEIKDCRFPALLAPATLDDGCTPLPRRLTLTVKYAPAEAGFKVEATLTDPADNTATDSGSTPVDSPSPATYLTFRGLLG